MQYQRVLSISGVSQKTLRPQTHTAQVFAITPPTHRQAGDTVREDHGIMCNSGILFLKAQTSIHAGTGTSVGSIDLPIQRERHTKWPTIQGSAVKGVLREAYRLFLVQQPNSAVSTRDDADKHDELTALFGRADGDTGYAGSISITDSRILAFPVRSARGVFAWVTCPSVIRRLRNDYEMAGFQPPVAPISVAESCALVSEAAAVNLALQVNRGGSSGSGAESASQTRALILEDVCLNAVCTNQAELQAITNIIATAGGHSPADRLVVVSDDVFTHFVMHCTEINTRIAVDFNTKRVKGTALFVVELLPAETIMYSAILGAEKRGKLQDPVATLKQALTVNHKPAIIQFGGEETTGKGWCWVNVEVKK